MFFCNETLRIIFLTYYFSLLDENYAINLTFNIYTCQWCMISQITIIWSMIIQGWALETFGRRYIYKDLFVYNFPCEFEPKRSEKLLEEI